MKGIYKIINLINGKTYIGSSKDLVKREKRHFRDLNKNKHHNIHLQRAFNKYGSISFIFEVVEECEDLFKREQHWIDTIKPDYNIGSVGGGDNYTNHPNKDKIREKLVKSLEENRYKLKPRFGEENPNWRGGSTYCRCGTKINSKNKSCIKCLDRSGGNNSFHGKEHSSETKDKIRKSKLGKPNKTSRKKVSINGEIYDSATIAAKTLSVSASTITYRVKSNKYDYKYINA